MITLAIDPGIRLVGAAVFVDDVLVHAERVKNNALEGSGPREAANMAQAVSVWFDTLGFLPVDSLVLEYPQIYSIGGGRTKGDPNDLASLFAVDGAIAALFPHAQVRYFHPHAWKGSVEKPKSVKDTYAIETRVMERLTQLERDAIEWPKNRRHRLDVVDAIGIGLHALGRFDKKRIIHRE